jgi:hypothetical protein
MWVGLAFRPTEALEFFYFVYSHSSSLTSSIVPARPVRTPTFLGTTTCCWWPKAVIRGEWGTIVMKYDREGDAISAFNSLRTNHLRLRETCSQWTTRRNRQFCDGWWGDARIWICPRKWTEVNHFLGWQGSGPELSSKQGTKTLKAVSDNFSDARVLHVLKRGKDPTLPSSYRPISLTLHYW